MTDPVFFSSSPILYWSKWEKTGRETGEWGVAHFVHTLQRELQSFNENDKVAFFSASHSVASTTRHTQTFQ